LKTGVCENCKAFTAPNTDKKECISKKCKKNEKITLTGGCVACKPEEKVSQDLFFCVSKEPKAADKKDDKPTFKEEKGDCVVKADAKPIDAAKKKDEAGKLTLDDCKAKCGDGCTSVAFKEADGKCTTITEAEVKGDTTTAGVQCLLKEAKAPAKRTFKKSVGECKIAAAAVGATEKFKAADGKTVEECEAACTDKCQGYIYKKDKTCSTFEKEGDAAGDGTVDVTCGALEKKAADADKKREYTETDGECKDGTDKKVQAG